MVAEPLTLAVEPRLAALASNADGVVRATGTRVPHPLRWAFPTKG
jgi:hypothetical protein